jgi:hypothetical protein
MGEYVDIDRRIRRKIGSFMGVKIPTSGPARLDHYVSIRLGALRMSRIELARRGGPDRSTLHKATTGDRTLSTRTLARLDQVLGWAEGTSAAILDGGEPVCASSDAAHVQTVLKVCEDLVEQSVGVLTDVRKLLAEMRPPQEVDVNAR